jgi:hypothetical protein
MTNVLMGRQQNALIPGGTPISNIAEMRNMSNDNVEFVIKKYSNMSKLLFSNCNFFVDCGIPESEVRKMDLGYLIVESLMSVYKQSYQSIGDFYKNGTLELPSRALSTIYTFSNDLCESNNSNCFV